MAEEVKIVVKQESQGNALDDTRKKIQELYKHAAAYESKGMDTAAKSARADARSLENDLAKQAKEHATAQKGVTRELREQEAVIKARHAMLRGVAAAAGSAGVAFGGTLLEDYLARQAMGIRAENRGASDARSFALRGVRGFSSGQALAAVQSTEDEIFDRGKKRKELKQGRTSEMLTGAWDGAWKGAAAGFFVGGPWGAAAGAAIGVAGGAYRGYAAGNRAIAENESDLSRASGRLPQEEEDRKARWAAEGGAEIQSQKARVDGRYKEAITIDMAREAYQRYQAVLKATKGDEGQAQEAASLTLRQREIDVQRGLGGLADVRSSRSNLAALASLGAGFSSEKSATLLQESITVLRRIEATGKNQGVLKTHVR